MRNPLDFKIRCSAIGKIMGNGKVKGELSQTCKSYLEEWFANDNEDFGSKYTRKGNEVENDLIDFMAEVLGFGMAEKNKEGRSDEFIQGECDVVMPNCVIDVKAPWNRKTLFEKVIEPIDKDYEWQLQGYMHLYVKDEAILFYGLMNTPETEYSEEVIYEDMPVYERWVAYHIKRDQERINSIIERVKLCREYLVKYDLEVRSKIGKIN